MALGDPPLEVMFVLELPGLPGGVLLEHPLRVPQLVIRVIRRELKHPGPVRKCGRGSALQVPLARSQWLTGGDGSLNLNGCYKYPFSDLHRN